MLEALSRINGTYAIAVIDERHPNRIVAARNGSPLILGVGDHEMFVASDLGALVRHTTSVVHLDDGELATVTAAGFRTFSKDEEDTAKAPTSIDLDVADVELAEHEHFMHKEMLEQPATVERMLRGRLDDRFGTARLDGLNLGPRELRAFRRVKILGCGSAYYVGQIGAAMIEELAASRPTRPASEFRYRNPIIEPDTLYVAVSQSGETADTAFAVQEVKRKGGQVIGLVNVVGSTIARSTDGGIYLHAGPRSRWPRPRRSRTWPSGSPCSPWPSAGSAICRSPTGSGSSRGSGNCPARSRRSSAPSRRSPTSPRAWRARRACSSSAGSAASRWPARAPRNSRRCPTGTPRRTRPASSSTGRWR